VRGWTPGHVIGRHAPDAVRPAVRRRRTKPWEEGGETALHNCVMVCKVHHRLLHHSEWIVRIREGLPEFVPPTWIDPDRIPRRKPLPHLLASATSAADR
jgi:hypothetical protein